MRHSFKVLAASAAFAVAGLVASHASAAAINIDFIGWGSPGYTGVGVAPDAGTVWNRAGISSTTGFLNDSTGAATTVKFSTTISGDWNDGPNELLADFIYVGYGADRTFDITGLDANTAYDLYVYSSGDPATNYNNALFTLGGNNYWMTSNNAKGTTIIPADWIKVTVASDAAGTIHGGMAINYDKFDGVLYSINGNFNALQIVSVPEPVSLSLLGLAGLALLRRRK